MAFGSFLDKAKKAAEEAVRQAQEAADQALDTASKAAENVASKAESLADKAQDIADQTLDTALKAADKVTDKALGAWDSFDTDVLVAEIKASADSLGTASSQTFGRTSEAAKAFLDRTAALLDRQIRSMVAGLNLQETIDSVNKVGAEKGVDVAPLVDFIERLKAFGDGKN